jgi:hypothetical protein
MTLEVSHPNENGVLPSGCRECIARVGRSYVTIKFALGGDERYRLGIELQYSYGGFASPITSDGKSYATISAAGDAALEELLVRFPKAWGSEPQSVHDELRILREQVEATLRQPVLF